jgi:hypothetical protein
MVSIIIFFTPWMGLKVLSMDGTKENIFIPKICFEGSLTMHEALNYHKGHVEGIFHIQVSY